MLTNALQTSRLDRMAIALSGLCLVHCLGTTIFLAMVATAGGAIGAEWVHEVGIVLAMLMGAVALGRYMLPSAVGGLGLGVMAGAVTLPHGPSEAIYTMMGVVILALGHRLNFIAAD
jgi:hypothetical protein